MAHWDEDGMDGGTSSMDVLMRWIRTPGSRERWHHRPKSMSCEEIMHQLQVHGLERTSRGVFGRISRMADLCASASKLLLKNEKYELYHRGEADMSVQLQVEQRCPYYRDLVPFFKLEELPAAAGSTDLKRKRKSRATSTPKKHQKCETQHSSAAVADPILQLAPTDSTKRSTANAPTPITCGPQRSSSGGIKTAVSSDGTVKGVAMQ